MDVQMHSAAMPATQRARVASWRGVIETVAVVAALGVIVSAFGYAMYGVSGDAGSGWYIGESFGIADLAAVGAFVLVVLVTRVAFEWPAETPSTAARILMGIGIVAALLGIVSSVVMGLGVLLDDQGVYWDPMISVGEQAGVIAQAFGQVLLAGALGTISAVGFRWIGSHHVVEPMETTTVGPPPWHPEATPAAPSPVQHV